MYISKSPASFDRKPPAWVVTLLALAVAHGFDLLEETDREIMRILHVPAEVSRLKQRKKAEAGIALMPGVAADASPQCNGERSRHRRPMTPNISSYSATSLKLWLRKNRRRLVRAGVATITASYSGQGDHGRFDGFRVIDRNGIEIYYDLGMEFRDLVETLLKDVALPDFEQNLGGGGEIRCSIDTNTITHDSYYIVEERRANDEVTL
jgi:hypothetical protein